MLTIHAKMTFLDVIVYLFRGAVIVLLVDFFFYQIKRQRHESISNSARRFPFLGNIEFLPQRLLASLREYRILAENDSRKIIEYQLLYNRGYVINDAKIAKEILSARPKSFRRLKMLDYSMIKLNQQTSLNLSSGDVWKKIRKLTSPAFSLLNVEAKLPLILEECHDWIESFQKNPHTMKHFDVRDGMNRITLKMITIVAFGLRSDHEICSYFFSDQFLQDVYQMLHFAFTSGTFVLPRFFWRLSPEHKKLEESAIDCNGRFTANCLEMIRYKRQALMNVPATANAEMNKGSIASVNKDSMLDSLLRKEFAVGLTEEELLANVKTFFVGGMETTAVTLSWMLYYVICDPLVLKKAREEVASLLFESPIADRYEEWVSQYSKLHYCQAIMKETLRIAGPSSTTALNTEGNQSITISNGVTFSASDLILINNDGIHFNDEVFPSPEEFRPERWLEASQMLDQYFFAFGSGPRSCPGMNLANHEGVFILAFLIYYFHLEFDCPKEDIYRIRSMTSCPNQLSIKMTIRKEIGSKVQ